MIHKGIHHRGHPPHWDLAGSFQAVTFRLADALPEAVLQSWKEELNPSSPGDERGFSREAAKELRRRIESYQDAGHGSCILKEHGEIVQSILIAHQVRYRLIEWCVMPNHVHVLLKLMGGFPLKSIVQRWKGNSSFRINKLQSLGRILWGSDHENRDIRDMEHLQVTREYIRNNPVNAALCATPAEWPCSSAAMGWKTDFSTSLPTGLNPQQDGF